MLTRQILAGMDTAVIGFIGLLLMVIATGNFWPSFLNRNWVLLTLSKPISRTSIFLGRTLGAVLFVTVQASWFAAATLLAAGLRTGIWVPGHLVVVPITLALFLIIYSASTLIGVMSRSTVFAILAALGFWFLCSMVNNIDMMLNATTSITRVEHGRTIVETTYMVPAPAAVRRPIHMAYLVLPKIKDLDAAMQLAISGGQTERESREPNAPRAATRPGSQPTNGRVDSFSVEAGHKQPQINIHWTTSILTTLASVIVLYGLAMRKFLRTDY